MSWSTETVEEQRDEFCRLARHPGANISELCRRYGISRKTGYKWLSRSDMRDRSKRPLRSPMRTPARIEARVLELRKEHPAWGGRKIAHVLARDGSIEVAASTVTSVLHRAGLIKPQASEAATAWQRFEHPRPNALWQMDFKGHVPVGSQRCHPLTVLDDHSRFNIALNAMLGVDGISVQTVLTRVFARYGLPERINVDNGPPWGSGGRGVTALAAWLIRLGIQVGHSRPFHPQTNGKDERFHKTLVAEVLNGRVFYDFESMQRRFNKWRAIYNNVRPHEALGMQTPAEYYQPSPRRMPNCLPPIEYGPNDLVRKVHRTGVIRFKGRVLRTSEGLRGQPVALRADPRVDGAYDVFYCHQKVGRIDLNALKTEPA